MNPTTHFSAALLITAMWTISSNPCMAQTDSPTILQITVSTTANTVSYENRPGKSSPLASSQGLTYSSITQVNGQPASGTWSSAPFQAGIVSGPVLPAASTSGSYSWTFDIAEADGTPAGTLTAVVSPGAPNAAIVSATGAYFGAQGFVTSQIYFPIVVEPLNSKIRYATPGFTVTLYPSVLPSVAPGTNGPAVILSSDSAQVSASQPAHSGEIVTIYALNLLPQSGSNGKSSTPLPVRVTIGGIDAPVLWAGPYADSPDGYQLNVQIPSGLNSGMADLQLVSGFIGGPAVPLYVDPSIRNQVRVAE